MKYLLKKKNKPILKDNMAQTDKDIKNLKISKEVHEILKVYCDKRGIKIYHFLERLILEKCTGKKDNYED